MKILFFSNQGLSTLHLGIELEVLENLINEGHEIIVAKCNSHSSGCFFNPTFNPLACAICQARTFHGHRLLNEGRISFVEIIHEEVEIPQLDYNDDVEISELQYKGINYGKGVLSSVISLIRDYDLDGKPIETLVKHQIRIALKSLISAQKLMDTHNPDKVIFFNGRFSELYPILSLCKFKDIDYATFEVAIPNISYDYFDNGVPHSIIARRFQMIEGWEKGDRNKYNVGEKWFLDKVKGENLDDVNYTKNQKSKLLPPEFDRSKRNIAVFNSSEDELKTIDEWITPLFDSQNEILYKIFQHFEDHPDIHFYLRVHPNLNGLINRQTKEIENFKFKNVTIIAADNPVDSYELLKSCEKTVTFGSTIGIEATYHGKPSITVGPSFYSGIDATYEVDSIDNLYMLIEKFLMPKSKDNTLIYGYYISSRGIKYNNFQYTDKWSSKYKGHSFNRFYLLTFNKFLKLLVNYYIWKLQFYGLFGYKPSFIDLRKLKT